MSDEEENRLARAIQDSCSPQLDPARRARIRRRVLSARVARQETMPARGFWRRVALAAAGLAIVSLALGGAASASLPGDPTFPLKIEAERLQLLLSPDLYRRLESSLQHADRRLAELELLARRDVTRLPLAADAYSRTLADVRATIDAIATSEHSDRERAFEEARNKLDWHISRLAEVDGFTDGDVERALENARDVDRRVREVESEDDPAKDRKMPSPNPAKETSRTAAPTSESSGPGPGAERTPAIGPATSPRPSRTPDASRTADPTRTAAPLRTIEPTRTPDPTQTPEPVKTPEETRTPSPSPSRS
jgi:hypothetical protein